MSKKGRRSTRLNSLFGLVRGGDYFVLKKSCAARFAGLV
jgi:hypothetical protein